MVYPSGTGTIRLWVRCVWILWQYHQPTQSPRLTPCYATACANTIRAVLRLSCLWNWRTVSPRWYGILFLPPRAENKKIQVSEGEHATKRKTWTSLQNIILRWVISNQLFIVNWAISIFANDIFFFPWGRFNSESCYSFCPHSSNSDDISGVDTLVKMSLNWMTSKRLISIQEAVHEIDRLSLTLCSDDTTSVSLLSCAKLRKSSERKQRD
jgi:hypothetical protein